MRKKWRLTHPTEPKTDSTIHNQQQPVNGKDRIEDAQYS
jgi:hypothetical protein